MGARTALSLEEFLRLPDDGMRHELDDGELVVMPPARFRHTQLAKRIYDWIFGFLLSRMAREEHCGEVFMEAPYLLKGASGESSVRQPDVSYIDDDRIKRTDPGSYMEGAPTLAVEVVSPTDTAEDLTSKIAQYLDAGCEIVWAVYPAPREVHVFYSRNQGRKAKILREPDILTAPEVFPDWAGISLTDLFK